jgi:hypothetical protein
MQALVIAMLVLALTGEFFAKGDNWGRWALLPGGSQFAVELLGLVAGIIVVFLGTRTQFRLIRAQYWLVFGALLLSIGCGIVVNSVEAGPIFAGIRGYLRAIPWFLIPAVYAFSDEQVRTQAKVVMLVALLQLPLALQQRFTLSAENRFTGDYVSGTLQLSSIMSIFMIAVVSVAAALAVRGELRLKNFLLLFVVLLIPTMINETKATVVLLPISLFVALMVAAPKGMKSKLAASAVVLTVVFSAIYIPIYDYYISKRPYGESVVEKMSSTEALEDYLSKTDDIGSDTKPGRADAIIVPFKRMLHDPAKLTFGFGIGNASKSALGTGFVGEYFYVYGPLLTSAYGRILLELGLLGVILVSVLIWMILRDSLAVAHTRSGLMSSVAAGWAGVTVLIGIAMFYKDLIVHISMSCLFWYFSGLVAASRMRSVEAGTRS